MRASGMVIRGLFVIELGVGVLACGQALEQRAEQPPTAPVAAVTAQAEGPSAPAVAVKPTPPVPSVPPAPSSQPSIARTANQTLAVAKNAWDARGERMMMESDALNFSSAAQMRSLHAGPPPEFNTEQYAAIEEEGFVSVADRPLSTFSIDVDTASYSNVRRFLTQGGRPPSGAVRIEELINYFTYDYPPPTGSDPFSVTQRPYARCVRRSLSTPPPIPPSSPACSFRRRRPVSSRTSPKQQS